MKNAYILKVLQAVMPYVKKPDVNSFPYTKDNNNVLKMVEDSIEKVTKNKRYIKNSHQISRNEIKDFLGIEDGLTLAEIALKLDVPYSYFTTTDRHRPKINVRCVSMAYMYGQGSTLYGVGEMHGDKDHATVGNAIRSLRSLVEVKDMEVLEIINKLKTIK